MNKKSYLSPVVEIMNARVEKGFQTSGDPVNPNTPNIVGGLEDKDPSTEISIGDDFD